MSSLSGKTVLITGGSKGIGAATSILLAKHGANLAINYSSDSAAADKIVKEIGDEKAIAIKGDAGKVADIEVMVDQTVKKFGKIDILIPCAGILHMRDLETTTEAEYDVAMQLNVKGPYFLTQVRGKLDCLDAEIEEAHAYCSHRKLCLTCLKVPESSWSRPV